MTVDPAAIGVQIENLIAKMGTGGDAQSSAQAQELVRLLMSLYGAGLSRMLDIVRTEAGGPQAVLDRLGNDPLVASLLVLHDLHPHPIDVRVKMALAALTPHLPVQTQLTVLSANSDSVQVRVDRPTSAPMPSGGIRLAIERAIQEAAPEVVAVEIDGLEEPLIQIVRR